MSTFKLYTIELRSCVPRAILREYAVQLNTHAEIEVIDGDLGTIIVRFVSRLTFDHVAKLCDDIKIRIESERRTRLTYAIASTVL